MSRRFCTDYSRLWVVIVGLLRGFLQLFCASSELQRQWIARERTRTGILRLLPSQDCWIVPCFLRAQDLQP
ncbi:hypothetical protein C8F04DRAFT_1066262 [Mycena alexandri]|uniref:Uncharacterized protein n=1 Tax=Mycena alexandri TaxID=1745969 RepID=A0AAD6THK1_9AGAR|nr:hypothetical protein C8F04DRAFT_1066262 [Mycena alexandri]